MSVGQQILQPAKDVKFRTGCMKSCRQEKKSMMYQDRINSYHHSFLPATIRQWNCLPNYVIDSSNLNEFMNNLYMHTHTQF